MFWKNLVKENSDKDLAQKVAVFATFLSIKRLGHQRFFVNIFFLLVVVTCRLLTNRKKKKDAERWTLSNLFPVSSSSFWLFFGLSFLSSFPYRRRSISVSFPESTAYFFCIFNLHTIFFQSFAAIFQCPMSVKLKFILKILIIFTVKWAQADFSPLILTGSQNDGLVGTGRLVCRSSFFLLPEGFSKKWNCLSVFVFCYSWYFVS